MKRLIFLVALGIAVLGSGLWVQDTMATSTSTMVDYTAVPPFVGTALTPNILLVMDNSGSMRDSAYHPNGESYDAATQYGGYFSSTNCYTYTSSRFSVTVGAPPSCGSNWDGNFLNYVSMTKIEIAKWVMVGGKCSARSAAGACFGFGYLKGETSEGVTTVNWPGAGLSPFTSGTCKWDRNSGSIRVTNSNSSGNACGSGGSYGYTKSWSLTVAPTSEPIGIIQQVGNKARFGLMEFKGSGDGGKVLADVGSTPLANDLTCSSSNLPIVNAIECTDPSTWTPLAESLYEASRYFAQIAPAYTSSDYSYATQSRDPYYYTSPTWLTPADYVPCCKSFVIMFTDGQPTQDLNIPSGIMDYAHTAAQHGTSVHCAVAAGCTADLSAGTGAPPKHSNTNSGTHDTMWDHHDNCSAYYGGHNSDPCNSSGGHYLDDVAFWAHTTDLRPETGNIAGINATPNAHGLPGVQDLTLYTFFAFGTGGNLLKDASMTGAFDDLDGNGLPFKDSTCGTASPNPLCKEWDKDGDGVPDTYFESSNAFSMRDRLLAAITDILKRSASGTSVSILSTTEKGEGALYQAYFYPSKYEGLNDIHWLGYLQGLFLDSMGNLREDSNGNHTLDLTTDMIVKLVFDDISKQTRVERYSDSNGDGTPDSTTPSEIVSLDQIRPIWEGGKELALRSASSRQIYTWVDQDNDGQVGGAEFKSFDAGQASSLRPYLNAATTTESQNIIDFIRGESVAGYRDRSITVNGSLHVWKLGDIIYSTPVTVAGPKEQYDLVYKDSSYQQFFQQYQNRRGVVYVGANDGMLHAFNAGTYDSTTRVFDPGPGHTLGEELWAFIPQPVLPHLKWLTRTDYTHVYYVDLKPKVTDAKIFAADADHPGGWGTILIGGLRFGGGPMDVTDNFGSGAETRTFKSGYFVLDITNPEKPPVLLWATSNLNMGFTTSYPAVARVTDGLSSTRWVALMGAGPTTYDGERKSPSTFTGADTEGHLYVFDLTNGNKLRDMDTGNTNEEFMGDVTSLDGNLDYGVDSIYVGSAYNNGGVWNGKMYRVVTKNDIDPNNWTISALYSAPGPILGAPSMSIDSFLNIWVYFGTGRFMSINDKIDTNQQGMYGIKDPCWLGTSPCAVPPITYADLVDVSNAVVNTNGTVTGVTGVGSFGDLVSRTRSKSGWVLLFDPTMGERVLVKPIILGGIVLFSTFTPTSDVCGFQGEGKLYATYFETGSAYKKSVIGETTGGDVKRDVSLGQGIPSMAGLHVGAEEGVRGFVQQGTGSIGEIEGEPPFKFKSGVMTWQEKQM
jgi:type IV pilus assembly protein PilY1